MFNPCGGFLICAIRLIQARTNSLSNLERLSALVARQTVSRRSLSSNGRTIAPRSAILSAPGMLKKAMPRFYDSDCAASSAVSTFCPLRKTISSSAVLSSILQQLLQNWALLPYWLVEETQDVEYKHRPRPFGPSRRAGKRFCRGRRAPWLN
jgi:hypothetical protein